MKRSVSVPLVAALAVVAAVSVSCQRGVTGPTLIATVQNVSLEPSLAGVTGAETVCCCHVRGEVTNSSSVALHAEVYFPAKSANGQSFGTARDVQREIAAGATRAFLAVGIAAACKDVSLSQILADQQIRVKGIWEPD